MLSALSSEAEMAQAVGAEKGERVEGRLSYLLFQAVFGFAEKPFVVFQKPA